MPRKKPTGRPPGRPRAEIPSTSINVLFDEAFVARLERARQRRRDALPGIKANMSDTIRGLLMKALDAEEQAEQQAELPFTTSPESTTKKS